MLPTSTKNQFSREGWSPQPPLEMLVFVEAGRVFSRLRKSRGGSSFQPPLEMPQLLEVVGNINCF